MLHHSIAPQHLTSLEQLEFRTERSLKMKQTVQDSTVLPESPMQTLEGSRGTRLTRSHAWKLASAILALLFCLTLWLAEDTNLRHWLEDFTSSAKQGLEAVQIPENFAACLISSNPNDGLACLLCGHGAWVSEHLTRSGIAMTVLGTPGALIYALLAGFASRIPGTIFSVLSRRFWLAGAVYRTECCVPARIC